MITMQIAVTTEIDEVDDAVDEILGQLDLNDLKQNSAGIIFCYYDFIESGVVKELCARLPFDVIGMTSLSSCSGEEIDPYTLRLAVLTSDEVRFITAISEPLSETDYAEKVEAAYRTAREATTGDPNFIISFLPYLSKVSAADIVTVFDEITGGIPIWGSVTSGIDMSYEECRTIGGGGAEQNGLAMLLFDGPVDPEFFVTSISEKNIRENKAYVTSSDGCLLRTINDLPVIQYLESFGIFIRPEEATTVPFMVDYRDGSQPVAIGIYTINDDGSVLCGGPMPTGATVTLGEIDKASILETAGITIDKIFASGKTNVLLLPCVSRDIMLAPNQDDEMALILKRIGTRLPYMLGYAGGEVCPVKTDDGKYHNRFHNYTFSACVF